MAKSGMVLKGDKELRRAFKLLPDRVMKKVTRQAVSAALTPINKAAKRRVPVDSGTLKKSIGKKVKMYKRSGIVWGGVGIRKDGDKFVTTVDGKRRDPRKYAHLVEFGTEQTPARSFIRSALDTQGGAALRIMKQKLGSGVEREAAKLGAAKR